MMRYVGRSDTGEGFRMISAAEDCRDSAAEAAFNRCVVDAEATFFGARNWCVAVLGHGGSPDQVCPDDDPGPDGDDPDADGLRWMPNSNKCKCCRHKPLRCKVAQPWRRKPPKPACKPQ